MKYYIIEKSKENIKLNFSEVEEVEINDSLLGLVVWTTEGKDILFGYRAFTAQEFELAKEKILLGETVNIYAKDYVRASVVGEAEGRRFRGVSILEEGSLEAGTHSFDYLLTENREIDGVRFKAYGAEWNDKISMSIVDPDDNVLDVFVDGWHLDEPTQLKVYRAKLPAGLKIRVSIETSSVDLKVWCDAFLHEYPL